MLSDFWCISILAVDVVPPYMKEKRSLLGKRDTLPALPPELPIDAAIFRSYPYVNLKMSRLGGELI